MRILLFHKGGIGDVVFGQPLMRDLKAGYPGASLTVLTHRQGAELLELALEVDRVVSWGALGERWTLRAAREALDGDRFDVAVSTDRSLAAAWLLWRLGVGTRVGFGGGPEQLLYTHVAPIRPFEVLFARRFQRLAVALGLSTGPAVSKLRVGSRRRDSARSELLARGWDGTRPLVAAHVGGGWPTKQWPVEHLSALGRLLNERHGAQLVLLGGEADRERARVVASSCSVIDGLGTGIGDAVAMATHCRAAVGVDSGLSHAAAAAGVPSVFLFGPNDERSIALGENQRVLVAALPCRPCNRAAKRACPLMHHRCMRELTPELVAEALAPHLA